MKKNGFTLIEIIICISLLSVISTVIILSFNKKKNLSKNIPTILKDSILVYLDKNKLEYTEYCGRENDFNCTYITYKDLIENGLITDKVNNNYNNDSCFKISKNDDGYIDIEENICKSTIPKIILTKKNDSVDVGEKKELQDYIKNVNPDINSVQIKINNVKYELNYNISNLNIGNYSVIYTVTNKNNETDSKTLSLNIKGGTLADVIKQKLTECEFNNGYNEDKCAFKGANPENYMWYSGYTWRIIGINQDGTIKAITKNPISLVSWGERKNSYESSYIRQWLNELDNSDNLDGIFYNSLENPSDFLQKKSWDISSDPSNIKQSDFTDYIGMISEREYIRASTNKIISKDNWLNIESEFMTITLSGYDSQEIYVRNIDEFGNPVFRTQTTSYGNAHSAIYINGVKYPPNSQHKNNPTSGFYPTNPEGVRPVINFKSSLTSSSGSGKIDDPYILENENPGKKNDLLNSRYSGEYIKFSNLTWRIIKTDTNGTKIILNDYMKNNSSYIKKPYTTKYLNDYSDSPYFQTGRYRPDDNANIAYYLNNTYYNSLTDKSWIIISEFPNSRFGSFIKTDYPYYNDYRTSLTKVNSKKYINKYKHYYETIYYFTPIKTKFGLSNIGELFSGNDINLKKACNCTTNCYGCNKGLMTQSNYYINYDIFSQSVKGSAYNTSPQSSLLYRPITKLSSNIKISSGTGTPNDPYILKR